MRKVVNISMKFSTSDARFVESHFDWTFDRCARNVFVLLFEDLNNVSCKRKVKIAWNSWSYYETLLMIDSKMSSSNGEYFALLSCGMQAFSSAVVPNTSSASRTLYNAGLSQKILRISSFLTNTRLPLCSAIMFGLCFIAVCTFSDRTAIVTWFFFDPTSMIWYSASKKPQKILVKIFNQLFMFIKLKHKKPPTT